MDLDDDTKLDTLLPQGAEEQTQTPVESPPALDHRENISDQDETDSREEDSSDDSEVKNQLVDRDPTPQFKRFTRVLRD